MNKAEAKIVIEELEKLKELSYNYEEHIDSWGHDDIFVPNIINANDIDVRIEELKELIKDE